MLLRIFEQIDLEQRMPLAVAVYLGETEEHAPDEYQGDPKVQYVESDDGSFDFRRPGSDRDSFSQNHDDLLGNSYAHRFNYSRKVQESHRPNPMSVHERLSSHPIRRSIPPTEEENKLMAEINDLDRTARALSRSRPTSAPRTKNVRRSPAPVSRVAQRQTTSRPHSAGPRRVPVQSGTFHTPTYGYSERARSNPRTSARTTREKTPVFAARTRAYRMQAAMEEADQVVRDSTIQELKALAGRYRQHYHRGREAREPPRTRPQPPIPKQTFVPVQGTPEAMLGTRLAPSSPDEEEEEDDRSASMVMLEDSDSPVHSKISAHSDTDEADDTESDGIPESSVPVPLTPALKSSSSGSLPADLPTPDQAEVDIEAEADEPPHASPDVADVEVELPSELTPAQRMLRIIRWVVTALLAVGGLAAGATVALAVVLLLQLLLFVGIALVLVLIVVYVKFVA
ncbi:hypothetical protein J8273_6951 [Carpediemonas membranifera]|uniref:Uncharacterized protein n=1 Tax=Carpediemonas membranifera TaxID=201153 RepID=A0A8J6BUU1_9EUKA|nr:hypothetical protein J8273_6951 [Carpediemonas membranifera]|eukprot:KAG9390711.1 hypothetical protein J8273_6951 [Carpediemonas membranifera]